MNIEIRDVEGRLVLVLQARDREVTLWNVNGLTVAGIHRADDLSELLSAHAPRGTPVIPIVGERPRPTCHAHAVLLLALTERWPWLGESTDSGSFRQHHLTLAHALPLALDAGWRAWTEDQSELLIRGGQLVVVPADELVAVRADAAIASRHRRLLRRHTATQVREHHDFDDFLGHWSRFVVWRYGPSFTVAHHDRAALSGIMAATGAVVREFHRAGDVIARSVLCLHRPSGTLFDLMATWHPRHASLRPGILSAVHNLLDAANRDLNFCLCYGQFPYKDEVVGASRRITLEDLLRRQ